MQRPEELTENRKARNEATFREANETLRAVQDDLGMPEGRMPFICECDDPDCRSIVRITQTAYEDVRANALRFVIAPGHTTLGDIVERHSEYCVVEKSGPSAEVAEETDPRRNG